MSRLLVGSFRFSVISLLIACFGYCSVELANAAPPENFSRSLIIGSGLNGPSGFEVAPDGRIFVLERTGTVKIFKNGQVLAQPFIELPSIASGDRGLIGIAFDPDFTTNHYVYFYYTALDKLNYLVRVDASGDVATETPHILFQTTFPSELLHVGGSIRFGNDGKMYFAVGDNGNPPLSQQLDNPHGKIHRINKDGTIPEDNPFYNTPGALKSIWAYGFRNPWRFQFDAATGSLYGGDVGDYTWEEVNKIEKGKNYGWPLAEGFCTGCPYQNPIYAYNHDGMSSSVTGGPVYRAEMFPEEYRGNLFISDYARGFIRRIVLNAQGQSTGVIDFDTQAGAVVDLKVANDGSLYYLTYYPGHLYRISYSEGNSIPVVFAGSDVKSGGAPLTVNFSSAGTFDPDDDVLSYAWNFGDGTTSIAANPTHTYTQVGRYEVNLVVTDSNNDSSQAIPLLIQVGIPPEVTIGTPADGAMYSAGDEFVITAHAVDAFGNDLSDANYRTDVIYHHATHTHPFLDGLIGRSNTFTIPDSGEAAADTWYRIRVTVSDENGLQGSKEITIHPKTSEITLSSNLVGIPVYLDGKPKTTPHTFTGIENFRREISADPEVEWNGKVYRFTGWSDGKTRTHEIRTPVADTTYTAQYVEVTPWNAQYFSNTELTGPAALTRLDKMINFEWYEFAPAPSLPSDQFSVRWVRNETLPGGLYTFYLRSDDGMRVYVDDQIVVDRWFDQGAEQTAFPVQITAGTHEIKVEYYEAFGGAVAQFHYEMTTPDVVEPTPTPIPSTSPTPSPSTVPDPHTGFVGSYYANETLTGQPVVQRIDGVDSLDMGWQDFEPQFVDQFSVRWIRHYHDLVDGMYRFCVTADDGVRLKVNDDLIVDEWKLQGATEYCAEKLLQGGHDDIVIEYFEHFGDAVLKFNMTKIGEVPVEGYQVKYWNVPSTVDLPYTVPTTTPTLERIETVVDNTWGNSSPEASVQNDKFIAQWTRTLTMPDGRYKFTTVSDDGIRVYVDGNLVIDQWRLMGAETHVGEVNIEAGQHTIVVEYFEHYGDAVAKMSYERIGDRTNETRWLGEYWNMPGDTDLPYVIPAGAPTLSRRDAAINFDWQYGTPGKGMNNDKFVVRWTKQQQFAAGAYTFTTVSDDGVRVYVDDQLVIDQWKLMGSETHTAQKTLTEGMHTVKVEYFEHYGGAVINLQIFPN